MIGEKVEVPDFANKITTFRTWDLLNDKLVPLVKTASSWDEKVQVAECKEHLNVFNKKHQVPDKDCSCGLYGFFDIDKALNKSLGVVGVTEHWGKTEVHQDGLRSQYAQIKALAYAPQKRSSVWLARNPILASLFILNIISTFLLCFILPVTFLTLFLINPSITISLLEVAVVVFAFYIIVPLLVALFYIISGQELFTKTHVEIFVKQVKYLFTPKENKMLHLKNFCQQNDIVFVENYEELRKYCDQRIPEQIKQSVPDKVESSESDLMSDNIFKPLR